MHWSSLVVAVSPASSTRVMRPATVSYVVVVSVVRHFWPAPSSSEVRCLLWTVPARSEVTGPQSRTRWAVWWCQGRLTVFASTLPPGPEKVTVL